MIMLQIFRRKCLHLMERVLPGRIMNMVRLLYPPSMLFARVAQLLRHRRYEAATANLPSDFVLITPQRVLRAPFEAKESYEHFCWITPRMIKEMQVFLTMSAECNVLYDVGALHGVFSLAFTCLGNKNAIAFEPSMLAAKVLLETVAMNPQCAVTHVPMALGRENGTLAMRSDWHHSIAVANESAIEGCCAIPMARMDDYVTSGSRPPDCIKIDVEGHEGDVLRGGIETLRSYKPLLFIELHPSLLRERGETCASISRIVESIGYECRDASGKNPFFAAGVSAGEIAVNIIAIPKRS